MIGLIPHLLTEYLRREGGEEALRRALAAAGLPEDHRFHFDRPFDDAIWRRLFESAAAQLVRAPAALNYHFGQFAAEQLLARFPGFFVDVTDVRSALLRQVKIHDLLARTIHDPEARAIVAQKFSVVEDGAALVIRYRSPNDHLEFYRGILDRLAEHMRERVRLSVDDRRTGAGADYLLRLAFLGSEVRA